MKIIDSTNSEFKTCDNWHKHDCPNVRNQNSICDVQSEIFDYLSC